MEETKSDNANYCLKFDDEKYNNYIFKLILIEEIKRFSNKDNISIQEYYKNISLNELKLQLICVDATLSRGTLALAEKYMIKNGLSKNEIKERTDILSDKYIHYLYSQKIYDELLEFCNNGNVKKQDLLVKFKELAENGCFVL